LEFETHQAWLATTVITLLIVAFSEQFHINF
jgi:hypothetical protein